MMKLSDAIDAGRDSLKRWTNTEFYDPETCSGCAIGMAMRAVGAEDERAWMTLWPWLLEDQGGRGVTEVTALFGCVLRKEITLDQLIDAVMRLIERAGEEELVKA